MEEKVKAILAQQLKLKEGNIKGENLIIEELGASSFDYIEIAFALEHEFNIEIPDDDMSNIRKVNDIVQYIVEKIA